MNKKELKQEYKNHKPIMGVFQIENLINGKIHIEASTDIMSKWNRIQSELNFGSHRNIDLQKDWNGSSAKNFSFTILSELKGKEGEIINYSKELKILKEMVLEEIQISEEKLY